MAELNWKQTYNLNSTTTFLSNDIFYLARSPYGIGDDFGFLYSSLVPVGTKGDLFTFSTNNAALPVGSTNGQILQVNSAASAGLSWSTAAYPATTTLNQLLFSSSANVVSGIPTSASSVLITNSSSTPAWSSSMSNGQVIIGSTSGTPTPSTLTAGNNISITNGSNSITIASVNSPLVWSTVIGTSQTMASNHGYFANNASLVTFTLPSSPSVGDIVAVVGEGSGGWQINAPSTQTIYVGDVGSNSDGTGYISSTSTQDAIQLICYTSSVGGIGWVTQFAPQGNIYVKSSFSGTNNALNNNLAACFGLPLTTGVTGILPVANGGTNASSPSITAFNNITGYSASGSTGTTSTNLVFSTSPVLTTPNLGTPSAAVLTNATGLPLTTGVAGILPTANGGTNLSTYALGDTLYASATNTLSKLSGNITSAKQYLSQTGTGIISAAPIWATISGADITGAALTEVNDTNVTLTLGGSPSTALLNAASITAGWTGTLSLTRGGTAAALTASNGGIVYSSSSALAILAGTSTASQILLSGSSSAPAWSTATYPATISVNQLLYSSSANVIGGLASSANGVLITNNSSVPSWLANSSSAGYVLTANSGAPPSWQPAASGFITEITGDSGTASGSNITLTGDSNGGFFTASGSSVTLSFNYLKMPTSSSTNGQITINGAVALQMYGTSNFFAGSAGNFTLTGGSNTGVGHSALISLAAGTNNTAFGVSAGSLLSSGSNNVLYGYAAGSNYLGGESSNICIGSVGVASENNAIHIGTQGTSPGQQSTAYIAGITGNAASASTAQLVFCDSSSNQMTVLANVADGVLVSSNSSVPSWLANSGTAGYVLTANSGAAPSWQAAPSVIMPWTTVTGTSQSMTTNNGYTSNNAGLVTLTLPTTSAVGDVLKIAGLGAGGFKIGLNASQLIHVGSLATTTGTSGSVASTNQYDTITLQCLVANTTWTVMAGVTSGYTVV